MVLSEYPCLYLLLSSHPKKGRLTENSVRSGDILLAESVLQVVEVAVGVYVRDVNVKPR